jgi:glycosyltransferase involved in cell wall biosynthesis
MTGASVRSEGRLDARDPDGRGGPAHVGIIVQNLPVPLDRRVWNECQTLVAAGYRVSVICPRGPGQSRRQHLDGVDIHTYRPPPPARGTAGFVLESVVSWLCTLAIALRIHHRHPVAAWQACNPPDTYWAIGALFKRTGARFVFDHHDLCPEIYRTRFDRHDGLALRILLLLERATFAVADHVIVTNESYRSVAIERGRRARRDTTVVRSGPDPERLRPGPPDPQRLRGHRHIAAYLGVMGHQDGVDVIVRAADLIVHRWGRTDVGFVLMGFGDCLEDLRSLTTRLGLDDHVHFTGRVDLPEIRRELCTASIGLSPDPRSPFNDVSTMNKTLEYMACGLPVVAYDLRETRVSAGPAAWYAPGDDVESFAKTALALIDEPEARAAMGRIGRERIEDRLGWPTQATAYADVYRALLGDARLPAPPERDERDERTERTGTVIDLREPVRARAAHEVLR